jgi:uncharacterized protein YjbI with pentapeptide repeats
VYRCNMAAIDQLHLLRSGTGNWNRWREQNPNSKPDLDGADLRGTDMKGANLSSAGLSEADLSNANLAGANLVNAELSRATLDRADLSDADLQNANARFARLRGANLTLANLCFLNLQGADLRGAVLQAAEFGHTVLGDTDLTEAKHLETCRFWAPVVIDYRTIVRSAHLPASFLRGCGVPEEMIENLPLLFPKPIHAYSVLIKSAPEDRAFAERLSADLQVRGLRCWTTRPGPAAHSPARQPGMSPEQAFQPRDSSVLLVVSRHSASANWLERDVQHWMQNERLYNRKSLFAVRLDESVLRLSDGSTGEALKTRAVDFRRWKDRAPYTSALSSLLSTLSS